MIWIIGSKGMLGRELVTILSHKELLCSDIDVDITSISALREFSKGKKIEWIINCSAYTAVDKAENESEKAFLINETGVQNISRVAFEIEAKLIHISTDYVFDGTQKSPRKEIDTVAPIGVYGASKLAGEQAMQSVSNRHFIIRTSWLYGIHGNNFVKTMLRLQNEKESLKVVNDQIGSPTWTVDLCNLINIIITKDSDKYGVFHYSNEGQISWFDFANEIYKQGTTLGLIKNKCIISSCTSDEFPTPAKRPAYSLMSKEKVVKTFEIEIPDWKESLQNYLQKTKNEA